MGPQWKKKSKRTRISREICIRHGRINQFFSFLSMEGKPSTRFNQAVLIKDSYQRFSPPESLSPLVNYPAKYVSRGGVATRPSHSHTPPQLHFVPACTIKNPLNSSVSIQPIQRNKEPRGDNRYARGTRQRSSGDHEKFTGQWSKRDDKTNDRLIYARGEIISMEERRKSSKLFSY